LDLRVRVVNVVACPSFLHISKILNLQIVPAEFRAEAVRSGCCGIRELIKMYPDNHHNYGQKCRV
jgi:hypothetical protein